MLQICKLDIVVGYIPLSLAADSKIRCHCYKAKLII